MSHLDASSARRNWLMVAAALLLVAPGARSAAAAAYQFQALYTSGPPPSPYLYSFFGDAPAINNLGELAFTMRRSGNMQPATQGLWRGNGGTPTLIASDATTYLPSSVTMNNLGEVAYLTQAGAGIFKSSGGAPITIADTNNFHSFNQTLVGVHGTAEINDAGQVLFNARPNLGPQVQTAYVGSGGPVTPVGPSDLGQAMNNLGVVAVPASSDSQIVAIPPIGPSTTIASLPPGYIALGFPQINNAGDALVLAYNSDFKLFHFQQGVPTLLAQNSNLTYDINNAGGIAYIASPGGAMGIYTGTNPLTDAVIRIGDTLFGSTVTAITFGSDGLNDLGQVGFFYQLANGRTGMAIATPVPEPGSLTLVVTAMLGACWWLRRTRAKVGQASA